MEVPFLKPVATVLSHFNEEVPYKPNASIYKYRKFFRKKQGKKFFAAFFRLSPSKTWEGGGGGKIFILNLLYYAYGEKDKILRRN